MAYTDIDDPSEHFQIALHASSGSATITNDGNSNLQPDFLWSKAYSYPYFAGIWDSTRGVTKYLRPETNVASGTSDSGYDLISFNTDGFSTGNNQFNTICANTPYVAWQWKANGGTRTTFTESGDNPGGGYQANTTAGFSIVDYVGTGATGTVAHGLGAVPKMIIVKSTSGTRSWTVYHHQMGSPAIEKNMHLNTTAALTDYNAEYWGGTTPTSSVFSLGNGDAVNHNNENYIAYCWAEVQGYSKFGSYLGNGQIPGPMVYTGFKPAFVMLKNTTATEDWVMYDIKRNPFNPVNLKLAANEISQHGANSRIGGVGYNDIDIFSNGFSLRTNNGSTNSSKVTYIYMAFAENPFVTSTGIPTTAR